MCVCASVSCACVPSGRKNVCHSIVLPALPGASDVTDLTLLLPCSYPECDIPVVQLSLPADLSGRDVYSAGEALSVLRDEGVLLIGVCLCVNGRGAGGLRA
jgi:hypothetical protein